MYSWFILFPLLSVIILNLPFRGMMNKIAIWYALALSIAQVYLVLFPVNIVMPFLQLNLNADIISRAVLLCIAIVLFVTILSAKYLIKKEDKLFNFVNLLFICLAGMNGVTLVTDIFSLYVFIEITAVASYTLISFYKDKDAFEAAFKYIMLSAMASAMMLAGIALIMLISGDTGFFAIREALKVSPHSSLIVFAIAIFICALFIKGGLMPFHGWLPDAYSAAPAPVSVLLAGVVTKTLGIYGLIRIMVSVIGFDGPLKQALLFIGALSIVVGALAALGQSDFKRMLAYSSISQVGYIIIGLGTGTALGIFGAVFHLFNHAIFKSSLFLNSAAVESRLGTRDMDKMNGLASKMPVTGITSVISCLSAAGLPPLAGFWSKLIIIVALWVSGYRVYAVVAIMASVITLAYFLSLQRRVFFGRIKEDSMNIKEAGIGLTLPAVILTAIIIGVGIAFPFLRDAIKF
ncbi:MAG: proton-conducting transporter membrane subunit [Candidatus Omnitrophota bacterium]|nr:proton-conducting transporter membrane subunit [Candidatus Omnitrophota bacterium]